MDENIEQVLVNFEGEETDKPTPIYLVNYAAKVEDIVELSNLLQSQNKQNINTCFLNIYVSPVVVPPWWVCEKKSVKKNPSMIEYK